MIETPGRTCAGLATALTGAIRMMVVAVLASLMPGLRAARVDPMVALRED